MLTHDWFAGHRDWWTGEPLTDNPYPTDWDLLLDEAYQIIEDYTDDNGILIWERESDRVTFDAIPRVNKALAARDKKTSGKNYKPRHGEYWEFKPILMRGTEWPTLEEYFEEKAEKAQGKSR